MTLKPIPYTADGSGPKGAIPISVSGTPNPTPGAIPVDLYGVSGGGGGETILIPENQRMSLFALDPERDTLWEVEIWTKDEALTLPAGLLRQASGVSFLYAVPSTFNEIISEMVLLEAINLSDVALVPAPPSLPVEGPVTVVVPHDLQSEYENDPGWSALNVIFVSP